MNPSFQGLVDSIREQQEDTPGVIEDVPEAPIRATK